MAKEQTTTIEVTVSVWKGLNKLKKPGDSFNDILMRLLGIE